MTKTFRENCDKNIVQQKNCEPLFPDVQMQSKMYFFVPFVRPRMHHKYGGISESHASEISNLCEISDLLFFVSYFASQSKGIKFGDYFLMCVV